MIGPLFSGRKVEGGFKNSSGLDGTGLFSSAACSLQKNKIMLNRKSVN